MVLRIRVLVLAGAPLLAFGLAFVAFDTAFLCVDACPAESDLAATIGAHIADAVPLALLCAVPVAAAWLLCLAQFARAAQWGALAALALALPLIVALAWIVLLVGTDGHPLPTTWLEHNSGWDSHFANALAVLLLWPLATLLATFALRQGPARRVRPFLQPADSQG